VARPSKSTNVFLGFVPISGRHVADRVKAFWMDETAPYLEQLRELERRRNQFIALWFGVGASVLVLFFLQVVRKSDGSVFGAAFGIFFRDAFGGALRYGSSLIFMGVFLTAYFRVARFPCPRCSKPFMTRPRRRRLWRRPSPLQLWTGKCLHCGLPALDSL
jgi:hypothetical protein